MSVNDNSMCSTASNRHLTTNEIESECFFKGYGSIFWSIKETLCFRKVCAMWAPYSLILSKEKPEQLHWEVLELLPYIPQHFNFPLFGPLKEALKVQTFNNNEYVEAYVRNWLETRPTSVHIEGMSELPIW